MDNLTSVCNFFENSPKWCPFFWFAFLPVSNSRSAPEICWEMKFYKAFLFKHFYNKLF